MTFLPITAEELPITIKHHSRHTMDARQVWRRLESLLPQRLKKIRIDLTTARAELLTAKKRKERHALHATASMEYAKFINEIVEVANEARIARVNYETYVMLFQARQSLRTRPGRG